MKDHTSKRKPDFVLPSAEGQLIYPEDMLKPKRLEVPGPRWIPYRIRLWWDVRKYPVCDCGGDGIAPYLHSTKCPVYRPDWPG